MSSLNSHQFGPYEQYDDSDSALSHRASWNKHNGVDAWGDKIRQPFDGHGAFNCNNYNCVEHPTEQYAMYHGGTQVQGMPGWLAHDTDPDKDVKRAVGGAFHEAGMTEDAHYLLDMNKRRGG